jgi:deoxycytidylate deaminase
MEILKDKKHEDWVQAAAAVAKESTCLRSRCGTVIVKDGEVIGSGYNSPPQDAEENRKCSIKETLPKTFKSDKTGCVHAEQRAIMDALRNKSDLSSSWLYFIRIDDDGKLLKADKPYCTICSKLALDAGISKFILWHEEGITAYNTKEYNDLSFDYE